MNKKQVKEILNNMDCEIAQIDLSFSKEGKAYHTNVLVYLTEFPSNDDQIVNSKHWYIFSDIDEFSSDIYYRTGSIVDFINVSEFKTDFK